jgi:hypothetical protein
MTDMSPSRAIGAVLVMAGVLSFALVAANDHTRRIGGNDLRPLMLTGSLMLAGGIGLISRQRWIKNLSTILLATVGVWVVVHALTVLPMPAALFSVVLGIMLLIPFFLTVRRWIRLKS